MSKRIITLILLCSFYAVSTFAQSIKNIRQVEADEETVVSIRAAIGYSTIIQLDSKPLSAVLGDQDAFKLEYVGNNISLKPLIPHAKSNLFIFTEYDRFNCTIQTVGSSEVDYRVKLSAPKKAYPVVPDSMPSPTSQIKSQSTSNPLVKPPWVQRRTTWGGYSFLIYSYSQVRGIETSTSYTIYDFELESKHLPYNLPLAPFEVIQKGKPIPIESVYLDSPRLNPEGQPVRGKIVLLDQEYLKTDVLTLIFRAPGHRLQLTMPPPTRIQTQKRK